MSVIKGLLKKSHALAVIVETTKHNVHEKEKKKRRFNVDLTQNYLLILHADAFNK